MATGRAVGIDLGTTYSAVASVDEYGKPVVLKNADGQSTTPSAVFFDPPNYVVGETALQSTITDADKVVQFVKRFMGQSGYRVHVAGREYSPQFVSSLILRKIVQDASVELGGEEIDKAVITVPAYFTENQRHATMEAGQMAGLQVLRIINEPTAAALSYGMQRRGRKRNCLVYDLGGGTFDVTVLAIDDNELNVLSIGGDHHLGGKDFDDRIMNFIEEQVKLKHDIDISEDKEIEAELRLKCEAAKRQLTGRTAVPIALKVRRLDDSGNDTGISIPAKIELTREAFQEFTSDLLGRTEMLLESVFSKADLEWEQIDDVLLVGGSSRMPMVTEMLARVSGKKPMLHDPDECVAKGAALQAALLAKSESVPQVSVGHVLSHSLGVAVMRGGQPIIDHVVPSLTRLPVTQTREGYTTTVDNQTTVQIRVYEGESTDLQSYGKGPIGVFDLDTSPPRPKGQPKISVQFHCDENGRITAQARDKDTGQESRTVIALQSSRSGDESFEEAKMLAEAHVS
jgi:molecular chaperone DnaK